MEKINIAEILKGCPLGMELNCTVYEDVYFDYVDELNIIHCYIQHETHKTSLTFNQHGTPNSDIKSKCVIFPKGKNTWDEFVPPCKFKDGDIISNSRYIAIFHKVGKPYTYFVKDVLYYHCWYNHKYNAFKAKIDYGIGNVEEYKLATEEEKQKLFDTIKANGYRWNPETKTLEELIELKFNVGDIVVITDSSGYSYIVFHNIRDIDGCYKTTGYNCFAGRLFINNKVSYEINSIRYANEKEKEKLFKVIKDSGYRWDKKTKTLKKLPKFKVGNRIVKQSGLQVPFLITGVGSEYYSCYSVIESSVGVLPFAEQDDWELVPNRFDISTLKPFESRVLVRNSKADYWKPAIFGFIENYKNIVFYVEGGNFYNMCIPYEYNEHLLGKNDDCDEYYKTW